MFEYIDIHVHLDMSDFDEDRGELISNLQKEKIGVITIGVNKKSSFEAVALAEKYKNVFATIGFHPTDVSGEFAATDFSELIKNPKVVAVGECGLDFLVPLEKGCQGQTSSLTGLSLSNVEKKKQIKLFEDQIDFAVKNSKPLMIHCRGAYLEVLDILQSKKKEFGNKLNGNVHFFSGSREVAKQYLELDFSFSFGGVVTFTNDYDEVVKFIPLQKIMSETDAPFVSPRPYRGQRNSPLFIKEIVKKIAEIKQVDLNKVKKVLVQNAKAVFSLINK